MRVTIGPTARQLRKLRLFLVLLIGGAGIVNAAPNSGAAPFPVEEVQPGVFVHPGLLEDWGPENGGDVANLSFVVGSRCVAVIDTGGTPRVGGTLRDAIERTTSLPVCFVINTHMHPDHVLGNSAFEKKNGSDGSKLRFIASAAFPRALAAREPFYLNALQRDFGIALTHESMIYPSQTVAQSMDIDLGDRVLTLHAWPTAHTDNDLTVFDQKTRTLIAGDLLFVSHLPALDGSLRGWIKVLGELAKLDVATVVPGHGPVQNDWPVALRPESDYLNGLMRDTRAAIGRGWTIQQATDRIEPAAGTHWLLTDRFQRRNVTTSYAELEWEDEPGKASGSTPAVSVPKSDGALQEQGR